MTPVFTRAERRVIAYTDAQGLRNYRARVAGFERSRAPRWPWLLLLLLVLLCAAVGCARRPPAPPLLVVILPPTEHDIGAWADDDTVCILLPPVQALYGSRRCLSMRAIRGLILAARSADEHR